MSLCGRGTVPPWEQALGPPQPPSLETWVSQGGWHTRPTGSSVNTGFLKQASLRNPLCLGQGRALCGGSFVPLRTGDGLSASARFLPRDAARPAHARGDGRPIFCMGRGEGRGVLRHLLTRACPPR